MKIIMGKFCQLPKCTFHSNCLTHDLIAKAHENVHISLPHGKFRDQLDKTSFECKTYNGDTKPQPQVESAMEICPSTNQYIGLFHKENTNYESIQSEYCGYYASYSINGEVDEDNRRVCQADLPKQFIGSPRKRKAELLGPNTRMADSEDISSFGANRKTNQTYDHLWIGLQNRYQNKTRIIKSIPRIYVKS